MQDDTYNGHKVVWFSLWRLTPLSTIVEVSFIGGGKWSTWRKIDRPVVSH
jgi:hypothetical protein